MSVLETTSLALVVRLLSLILIATDLRCRLQNLVYTCFATLLLPEGVRFARCPCGFRCTLFAQAPLLLLLSHTSHAACYGMEIDGAQCVLHAGAGDEIAD